MLNRPFDGPIPGESLTREPKKFAWERPPEFVDPEETLMYYLNKMFQPKVMGKIMDAIEMGITIHDLTRGLLRTGVSEGLHTIDVGLLIAPAIHEAIKGSADELGIEYEEGLEDKKAEAEYDKNVMKLKAKRLAIKAAKEGRSKVEPSGFEEVDDLFEEEDNVEEEQLELPLKRGLMAKGDM